MPESMNPHITSDTGRNVPKDALLTDLARVRELMAFLLGEATLDGVWFGERKEGERGLYWWRDELRTHASGIEAMARDAAARNKGPWREVVWSSPSVEGQHTVRYNVNTDDRARSLFGEGACWGAFPDDAVIVEIRAGDDRHVF